VHKGNTALSTAQNVAVIGCGSGVPFKIDSGGSVRDPRASTLYFFVATTDTFGGNSGSGVYVTSDYSVAGILVRGAEDYVENGSCTVVNRCGETECGGEEITYVYPAIQELCAVTRNGSQRLCTGLPPLPPSSFTYTARNTDDARRNTVNKNVTLVAGQVIKLGTCTVSGASGSGDTYLRLYGPSGAQVAENDDSCDALSFLSYTVPAGVGGTYQLRAGCFSSESCGGTVAYTVQ
jgi:hypothetical protein